MLPLAALGPLGIAQDAAAENGQPGIFGLSPIESLLLFAPVILYGIFSFYRSAINPQAKVGNTATSPTTNSTGPLWPNKCELGRYGMGDEKRTVA
jgi:hypothetical protein